MESVTGRRVRVAYYTASRYNVKRQKLNMENTCKGILISPINQRKMAVAIKEFLVYLKMNHSKKCENKMNLKKVYDIKDVEEKNEKEKNTEENTEKMKIDTKEEEKENEDENEKKEKTEEIKETNEEIKETNEEIKEANKTDEKKKTVNIDKQLREEIKQTKVEFELFSPIKNIVKNCTFIKFDESVTDVTPSDVVSKLFTDISEKKNSYKFRMICKIIPFDYVCKPHLAPFVKTIVPVLKKIFTEGNGAKQNISPSDLMKLLNVTQQEREQAKMEEEAEQKEKSEKNNEETNVKCENNTAKNEKNAQNEKIKENNVEQHRKKGKQEGCNKLSWALIYKRTNTDNLKKHEILTVIDNCIGDNYVVDLKNPDFAIIVHVNEIMCGISIMKGYGKTKKLNISAFSEKKN